MKRRVSIGFLGTVLDAGKRGGRPRWRPSVSLCMQENLFIDRLELLHDSKWERLAKHVRNDIALVSPATEVNLHVVDVEDPWDFSQMYNALRDFSGAYLFDPDKEDYLVHITTGTHVAQICWFLLTEARHVPGRLLQTSPPANRSDFPKGTEDLIGKHSIIDLDLSRYDSITSRFNQERMEATSFLKSGIATRNKAFNSMIDEIEKVTLRSPSPVLLTGPTGAGKSQLAKRIFELKKTQRLVTGDFVEVNCATLRGDQAMSTLFGHVRGSFTGAQADRAGLMKAADKGVLFLDEIGELGLDEQAMCLRAIEEKRFFPLGSDKDVQSDFQLLAGTNRDLGKNVREGKFREDLLARLNMWTFELPALTERREDIEPNIDYELQHFSNAEGSNITFNKEARIKYQKFATSADALWRSNFRDLSASIARMGTLAPRGRIDVETVEQEIERLFSLWRSSDHTSQSGDLLAKYLDEDKLDHLDLFESAQLSTVLNVCRQSKSLSAAGRALFNNSRRRKTSGNDADRLRKYLTKFDLSFAQIR